MVNDSDGRVETSGDDVEARTDGSRLLLDVSRYVRARTTTEQHGVGILTLVDRMPECATGYLLAHEEQVGPVAAAACRLAPLPTRMFLSAELGLFDANTLGLSAVWARPLPVVNGIAPWRRGRLRIQPDALIFVDEPDAEISNPVPAEGTAGNSIGRTLVECERVRAAAGASDLWCSLLYATLNATAWRHRVSGIEDQVSGRSLGELIATLRGSGGYLEWYCAPNFGQDERILNLLRELGWEPVPTSEIPFMNDGRNQPMPQSREDF